jgi:CRISPR-associated protein Csy1
LDNAIKEFLSGRKADRIKKKTNANMTVEEILKIEQDATEVFLLDRWLPDAAKRAGQLSLVSHPSKFSHPSAKTSSIIADCKRSPDGFLRTGNANSDLDVFGNAAAMDVFRFLSLELSDGATILNHLEINSEKIKNDLKVTSVSYEELRTDLLAIKKIDEVSMTSGTVKQVYFPVDSDYHLLSVLTPSGLIFELRKRIQEIRFSEQVKEARADKKTQTYNEVGFDDLYGLSMIGFGGTKPQNISVLNSTYGGKAYLLSSIPPVLIKQKQFLPKSNFFTNILQLKNVKEDFIALHKLFNLDYDNKNIREGRDRRVQSVIDYVIEKMWSVRLQPDGWSSEKSYAQLPSHQKIWLDESRKEDRHTNVEWLDKIIMECARWFMAAYKKSMGNKAISLADDKLSHIKKIVEQNKEGLR